MTLFADKYLPVIETVFGHLRPGQEEALYDLACQTPEDGVILEVGAHKGRSTCCLAVSGRRVLTIDTFTGQPENTNDLSATSYLGEFFGNLGKVEALENVEPLIGKSSEFWDDWNTPIDMLFIDGGHQDEVVRGDFLFFFPWLKAGGILAMHDVYSMECNADSNGPNKVWCDALSQLKDTRILFDNLAVGVKL